MYVSVLTGILSCVASSLVTSVWSTLPIAGVSKQDERDGRFLGGEERIVLL